MKVTGFSANLYGWQQRYLSDGRDSSLEALVRGCAEAGLDAVEPGAKQIEEAKMILSCGVKISGTYVGLPLHEPFDALRVEETVMPAANRLAEAGGTDLVLNANPKGEWARPTQKTEEELVRQGDSMTRIARLVQPLGLKVSMHNHAAEKVRAEGDLRSVIDYSGPEVGLCIDTGWAFVAGLDPLDWVRKYPERIFALHLRNQRGDAPAEDLLEGEIDMAALIRLLKDIPYCGWLAMELWHPKKTAPQRTMIEDTQRSIAFLRQLLAE